MLNMLASTNSPSLLKECISGVASRARATAWRRMTAVITRSNALFATATCANLTRLFVDPGISPERERDDVSFSSMDLVKHIFSYSPFKNYAMAMSCLTCTFIFITFLLGSRKMSIEVGLQSSIVRFFVRISQLLLVYSSKYEMKDVSILSFTIESFFFCI